MNKLGKTLTPKQQQRRSAILNAVKQQLEIGDYQNLSMRQVAAVAGVSPSTLYEIYQNKDNLILASIREAFEVFSDKESKSPAGIERFVLRLQSIAEFFQNSQHYADITMHLLLQAQHNSLATEVLLKNAGLARRNSIIEMQTAKQLQANIDVAFYTRLLVSVTWGTLLQSAKGQLSKNKLEAELVTASLSVLLPVTKPHAKKLFVAKISAFID